MTVVFQVEWHAAIELSRRGALEPFLQGRIVIHWNRLDGEPKIGRKDEVDRIKRLLGNTPPSFTSDWIHSTLLVAILLCRLQVPNAEMTL
mmetsp:Transcript_26802/g.68122  ORF Transcript_26802/g.68122 Transcript_26802/m.68122 type:complete len:90 (-) Transcript_26802:13-282(-)